MEPENAPIEVREHALPNDSAMPPLRTIRQSRKASSIRPTQTAPTPSMTKPTVCGDHEIFRKCESSSRPEDASQYSKAEAIPVFSNNTKDLRQIFLFIKRGDRDVSGRLSDGDTVYSNLWVLRKVRLIHTYFNIVLRTSQGVLVPRGMETHKYL